MEPRKTRINIKTGKMEVESTLEGLPSIWLTVEDTEKHKLCSKCIPFGKCMGFKGGSEETRKRMQKESREFLEDVFANMEGGKDEKDHFEQAEK